MPDASPQNGEAGLNFSQLVVFRPHRHVRSISLLQSLTWLKRQSDRQEPERPRSRPASQKRKHPWSDCSNQGCRWVPPRHSRSQQVDHFVGQALVAEDDVELAGAGDLLEDFEFPQPHQDQAVRQQLARRLPPRAKHSPRGCLNSTQVSSNAESYRSGVYVERPSSACSPGTVPMTHFWRQHLFQMSAAIR